MDDEPLYEHRFLIAWSSVTVLLCANLPGIWVMRDDLARGGWCHGIVVQTSRWLGPGVRDCWVIASRRPGDLLEALHTVARQAELPVDLAEEVDPEAERA